MYSFTSEDELCRSLPDLLQCYGHGVETRVRQDWHQHAFQGYKVSSKFAANLCSCPNVCREYFFGVRSKDIEDFYPPELQPPTSATNRQEEQKEGEAVAQESAIRVV